MKSQVTPSVTGVVMIDLRTLGALDLRVRGGPELLSVLSQPKRVALLCYLALARPRGYHRRDLLLALFWPEADAVHAHGSLRQAVHGLRHSLGEEAVRSRGDDELAIDEGILWCDPVAFEDALAAGEPERALALYRGDLLPGFHVEGAPDFESWLEAERARLRERAAAGAWAVAESRERAGEPVGAVEWGRRALALGPADDAALRRLMELLERVGDRAGALAAYEAGARRLRAEYEIEPGPDTRALAERIRAHPAAAGRAGAPAAGEPENCDPAPAREHASVPGQGSAAAEIGNDAPSHAEPTGPTAWEPSVQPAAGAHPERRPWQGGARRRRMVGVAALLTTAAAAAAAGVWLGAQRRGAPIRPRRLVVVPFENRTGDASFAPLGEMAADWITQGLVESGIVEVADGSAALALARGVGSAAGLSEADRLRLFARETGSALIVTGGYYLKADSVALAARVVSARSGRLLGAVGPVFAPSATPALGVQPLRQQVLAALAVLLDERLAAYQPLYDRPPTYDAYTEYMAGLRAEVVDDQWAKAFRHYDRAFSLDTTFYRALLAAANAACIGNLDEYDAYAARIEKVRDRLSTFDRYLSEGVEAQRASDFHAMYAAGRKMHQFTPGSDLSVWSLAVGAGRVFRYHESLSLLRRLDPDRALAPHQYWTYLSGAQHVLADFKGQLRTAAEMARRLPASPVPPAVRLSALAALGRAPEARALAFALAERLARDTSGQRELSYVESLGLPGIGGLRTSPVPLFLAARELLAHGHAPDARALAHEAVRWCAERPRAEREHPGFRWMQAQLLTLDGRWTDADTLLAATDPPTWLQPAYRWSRAVIAARLGERARALELGRHLGPLNRWDRPVLELRQATLAGALGDRGELLRGLRALHAAGTDYGIWWLHTEPALLPYFREPEFRAILRPDD